MNFCAKKDFISLINKFPKYLLPSAYKTKEAENNYYITAKYLLEIAQRAHELFESSIVEEKRQLLKLVLSKLEIDNEKLLWKLNKPFDLMIECNDRHLWRPQRESNSYFRRERAMS